MLVALRIDTDRCNQDQIFVHVNAIDLNHQQIEAGEIGRHPILHARRRQRYEAAGGGRFRQTSPLPKVRRIALDRALAMAMRWTAAAMQEAARGFRRLKAHKQLPTLRAALEAHHNKAHTAPLLAKPSPRSINLGSDRFSMFNKKAGHPLTL